CFVEANRFRRDDVHERAALHPGKNRGVDLLGEFFFAHDDAAARTAQTFVRRCSDEMRVWNWAGMLTSSNESGNVRHVNEQNRAYRIGNLTQAWEVDDPRIR